jgi:hypothetical protein
MKYINLFLHISLLLFSNLLAEGFSAETLVKTPSGYTCIDKLQIGDLVFCRNFEGSLVACPITYKTQKKVSMYTEILIGNQIIKTTHNQKFYLPQEKIWLEAQNITTSHSFFEPNIPYLSVNTLYSINQPTTLYTISVANYHNFYISTLDICVHNFGPAIFLGLSWVFGGGITFTGISATVIATGLGIGIALSQKNGDSTLIKIGSSEACMRSLEKGPNDDDNDKEIIAVNNIKEFFKKTEFGQKIENSVEKTNKLKQGQSVYRVKKDIPEYSLKKGDQFYLDAMHKDHIEVFRKNGTLKTVFNLNGTENIRKTLRAIGRNI